MHSENVSDEQNEVSDSLFPVNYEMLWYVNSCSLHQKDKIQISLDFVDILGFWIFWYWPMSNYNSLLKY